MIRISNEYSINENVYQNIENNVPINIYPNRIIIPINNNTIFVFVHNVTYIYDVDGSLVTTLMIV